MLNRISKTFRTLAFIELVSLVIGVIGIGYNLQRGVVDIAVIFGLSMVVIFVGALLRTLITDGKIPSPPNVAWAESKVLENDCLHSFDRRPGYVGNLCDKCKKQIG